MRAINLIPDEERRGGSSGSGRSGGAVYALLGVLGVLLLAFGAYALLSRQIADREDELVRLRAETEQVSAQAAALKPYGEFAELSTQRVSALRTLAEARLDWERVLRELAVALPGDARLASLDASASAAGGAGGTPPTAGGQASGGTPPTAGAPASAGAPAPAGPTLTLTGCVPTDRDVADMLVRLRQMSGVRAVDLGQASEGEGESVAGAPTGCKTSFDLTVTFAPLPGTAAAAAPGAAPAPPAPAPAPAPAPGGQQ